MAIDPSNLINGKGISERLGVMIGCIQNWRSRFVDFPRPLHTPFLIGIPVWNVVDVDLWWIEYSKYLPAGK